MVFKTNGKWKMENGKWKMENKWKMEKMGYHFGYTLVTLGYHW